MPEYWFRYGVTEISAEIPDEIRHHLLSPRDTQVNLGEEAGELAEELIDEAEEKGVTILYDHQGSGIQLLRSLVAELQARGLEEGPYKQYHSS